MEESLQNKQTLVDSFKHPASFYIENGWVEVEQDRVFRYVTREDCRDFLLSETYKKLSGIFWPSISIVDRPYTHQCDQEVLLCIEVEKINHVSFFPEWAPQQVLDALVFLCDLEILCLENNYFMQTHCWNVVLYKGRPFLIDIGDFVRCENKNVNELVILNTIFGHFTKPVGHHHSPTNIMENFSEPFDIKSLMRSVVPADVALIDKFKMLRDFFLKQKTSTKKEYWSNYNKVNLDDNHNIEKSSGYKSSELTRFIRHCKPESLTDLGCNSGIYSIYASRLGIPSVGIDLDKYAVEQANNYASEKGLEATFLSFDIMVDEEPYGKDGVLGDHEERLKSDMAVAPALIHHIYRQGYTIEQIASKICDYCKKYVAIEYIAFNDKTINSQFDDWFTIDEIVNEMLSLGFEVSIAKSNLLTRKWILGKRVEN